MPVSFLSNEQRENYGRYTGAPSPDDLTRYFHLDDSDHALIAQKRGAHNRLGFAVQLGTVRYLGTFLEDPLAVPAPILHTLAKQLRIAAMPDAHIYSASRQRLQHAAEIQTHYGYVEITECQIGFHLTRWLYALCCTNATTTSAAVNIVVDTPPTVSLTSPAANTVFTAPASIVLTASAADSDGSVTKVEFYQGSTLIGTATQPPYTVTWANAPIGNYSLTAKATDNKYVATTSAAVPIGVTAGAARVYYLHSDHLDTPRLVTDETNTVVWRNDPLSEPFGMSPPEEDPDGDGQAFTMNLRFPGQYADRETNTNYNYFRDHYLPDLGRYGQSDPIGLQGGINTYSYVGGSPLSYADPLGLAATVVAQQLPSGGYSFYAFGSGQQGPISGTFNTNTANFNQLQPGTYAVNPRPTLPIPWWNPLSSKNANAGRPTISNTANWNTVASSNGTITQGAQIHPGKFGTSTGASLACMVTDQDTYSQLN